MDQSHDTGDDHMPKSAGEHARDIATKYELYLISVTFTILGLAIQTAKFEGTRLSAVFELVGWASLLASGLVALWRFQWLAPLYVLDQNVQARKQERTQLAQLPAGQRISTTKGELTVSDTIKRIDETLVKAEAKLDSQDRRIVRLFTAHLWLLYAGLLLLAIARGIDPACDVGHWHCDAIL